MTLVEYLDKGWKPFEIFKDGEYNEIIRFTYHGIRGAIREKAEEITLNYTHFISSKNGQMLGDFDISYLQPDIGFRDALKLILERDSFIKDHLQLVSESEESVTYRIILG